MRGDARRDARRPRRHLPGRLPRRQLARLRRLPAAGRRAVGARAVVLRARRRQARHPPEAVLHLPAALLRRHGRGASRAARPAHVHVVLGTRRDALVPPARLPGLRRPRAAALPGDAEGLPRRRRSRRTRIPSSTATTATGGRAAATAAAPTTTCRSSPSSPARRRSSSRTPACARSPSWPGSAAGRRSRGSRARRSPGCASRRGCRWRAASRTRRCTSCCRRSPAAASPASRRRRRATSSSTSRAIRTGATRGSSTCSARSPPTGEYRAAVGARPRAGAQGVRGAGSTG